MDKQWSSDGTVVPDECSPPFIAPHRQALAASTIRACENILWVFHALRISLKTNAFQDHITWLKDIAMLPYQ